MPIQAAPGVQTAPAVGLGIAEMIPDGEATIVDLAPHTLHRFIEGRHIVGEHPYGDLWG